jgi:uncharacterized protein (TIGR02611 family)
MLRRLKLQWRDLKCGRPGTRFKQRWRTHEQGRRSYFGKPLYITAGLFIFLVGLVMLPAPGPGCVVVFIGAAMMAEESFWVARLLDRIELRGRRLWASAVRSWGRASMSLKTASVALAAGMAGAAGWATFRIIN